MMALLERMNEPRVTGTSFIFQKKRRTGSTGATGLMKNPPKKKLQLFIRVTRLSCESCSAFFSLPS
jgi:hypothetical protein